MCIQRLWGSVWIPQAIKQTFLIVSWTVQCLFKIIRVQQQLQQQPSFFFKPQCRFLYQILSASCSFWHYHSASLENGEEERKELSLMYTNNAAPKSGRSSPMCEMDGNNSANKSKLGAGGGCDSLLFFSRGIAEIFLNYRLFQWQNCNLSFSCNLTYVHTFAISNFLLHSNCLLHSPVMHSSWD